MSVSASTRSPGPTSPLPSHPVVVFLLSIATLLAAVCSVGAIEGEPNPPPSRHSGVHLLDSETDWLTFGVGAFDVFQEGYALGTERTRPEFQVEYRFGRRLFSLAPLIGLSADTDGGLYGYGGVYLDCSWGSWILSPAAGLGGYRTGRSKDLDGTLMFFAEGTIAYQLSRELRVGMTFAHRSNGYTRDRNPGAESLLGTLAVALPGP